VTIPMNCILSKAWPWSSGGRNCHYNITARVIALQQNAQK